MTRTLFHGGRLFDGTGAPLAEADVVVEAGRILEVGAGLAGDEAVDVSGLAVLPGMFDCHVHVVVSTIDLLVDLQQPFSYQFFAAARNLERTLDRGITTVRDAGGADLGVKQAAVRKAREVVETHRDSFRRAVAAGVKVAMGTDSRATAHGENLRELGLMADGGMKPEDVLAATTSSAAELLGVYGELGTTEA